MNGITDTIQQLKKTLDQEEIDINKRKSSLDTVCYEKLRNIVDTSKEQVRLLQLQMQKNTSKYIADFSKKIEDPITCINTPYENILPSMIKGEA
jgi:wobble nucleotide-excising tRNase